MALSKKRAKPPAQQEQGKDCGVFSWYSGCANDIEFLDEKKAGNVLLGDLATDFLFVVELNAVCFLFC